MASSNSHEPSVAELRRDADRTRAHLTGTVEELRSQVADTATHVRDAVSPSTIKRQVKEYVRESSEDMLQSLQRRARENPLQAVAVGAGLAYPLWSLLRAIPAPLLLIGAGLALSRSTTVRRATDEALARAREAAADAADVTRQKMDEWRDTAASAVDRASELASSAQERVSTAVGDAKARATNLGRDATASMTNGGEAARNRGAGAFSTEMDRGTGALNTAMDRGTDAFNTAMDRGTDAFNAAMDRGTDAFNAASEKITNLAGQARQSVSSTYEQNPLLVAGIGLGVGAIIASALPATSAENRLFGDTSEKLRQRATDAAAEGLDAAKQAAEGVVAAASQEGLSPQGLASAADDMTRKARSVAERGVEAALGTRNPSSPTT